MKTIPPAASEPGPEGRSETRSNIFVAATIASAEVTGPIRIRNMSCQGALIEGGSLPPQGARVRVSRGSLRASGTVAWRKDNRAGIQFDSTIAVAQWLPHGPHTQQQKIDEIVYAHKNGATGGGVSAEAPTASPVDIPDELRKLEEVLRSIAEDFARDPLVCERHLASVQLLDVAAEKLVALARGAN